MNRLKSLYLALSIPTRRIFWFIALVAVLVGGFSLALFQSLLLSATLLDLIGVLIPYVLAFVAIISAISILYNRVQFGVWLFFFSTLMAMLAVPFVQEGAAFTAAVFVVLVTIVVPLQSIQGQKSTLIVVSGILVAGLILAIDIIWPGARAKVAPRDMPVIQIGTILSGIILLASIGLLYQSFNLRNKLLVLSLGASLTSVIVVSAAATYYTQAALTQNAREKLLTAARHTADSIDAYLSFNLELVKAEATLPVITRYLSAQDEVRGLADVQTTLQNLAARDSQNIRSYALFDKNANIVWDTRTIGLAIGPRTNQNQEDFFRIPYSTGKPYISPVRFSPAGTGRVFYISAPVQNQFTNEILGILAVEIRASVLEEILREQNEAAGQSSYAILFDEYNIILADPFNPKRVARSATELGEAQIAFLKAQKRLEENTYAPEISLGMTSLARGLSNINITPFLETGDQSFGESMQGAAVYTSKQPWKVAFLQPTSVALAPVLQQSRAITAAALLTSFLLGAATLFISRTITTPVERLTRAAEEISNGNLNVRAEVRSQDELGTLAATLNAMNDQLKQTLSSLEATIAERTADLEQRGAELLQRSTELELTNQRSQRRAEQLLAVSAVSNAIATVQNLDDLLPLITRTISEKFGFYHVGIFLNDASNQFAILRAANSPGGQRMLQRGHRLKIGETGIVGNVVAMGRPRIALDTDTDTVFFNNPDLPETRSEMALPLRDGALIIGALDVQSTEPNAFSEEDVEILSALAGQVSTAIRNARLFEAIQRSQAELQTILQQDARRQWHTAVQRMQKSGYYYDGAVLLPLEKPPAKEDGTLTIPITVRGQVIGSLGIRPPADRPLSEHELDIIKTVSERLAIAAENARLLEDSQKRAVKEQMIGEISAKIGASINLENIFQTAVEELGQALSGSQVSIRLKSDSKTGKGL
ncbi:MAG: hypothetical protein DDG60_12040 [Anaerolineae bacterium]|nr:MAG: hypothetical protein DDG60_12040 [Anaerolineae bacterium]